jgi:hypothetical protein
MQNLFVSFMRTVVPYGVALVLMGTGWLGIPVDSEAAAAAVTVGLGAVYYAAFRGLEELAERMAWRPLQVAAGVLLGWARPPAYQKPLTVPLQLRVDKAAMRRDADEFVRYLGAKLDDGQEHR